MTTVFGLTLPDLVIIGLVAALLVALINEMAKAQPTDTARMKVSGPPFIVVGVFGTHVAVTAEIGSMFKLQIEQYRGNLHKGDLIGVIFPDTGIILFDVVRNSARVDESTITVVCTARTAGGR